MKIEKNSFYADIKSILEQARTNAVRAVNFSMVLAYWQIGKRIVEEEQGGKKKANYGEHLLEDLSIKLTADFGKGFTYRNIAAMRQFYSAFPILHAVSAESQTKNKSSILHAVSAESAAVSPIHKSLRKELSWTHYRLLIRVENKEARNYYMNEAAEQNWSS